MNKDIDTMDVDELTDIRKAAKLLWDSGILEPHEKEHMWKVMGRIDDKVREARTREDEHIRPVQ